MTGGLRTVLSPILMMNYVLGLRIIEFPVGQPRPRLSFLYILLLWSVYYSVLMHTVMPYIIHYTLVYHICIRLNIIAILLSIVSEAYQNQKFRNCLKKLAMLDDTLEMLGITTDYEFLRRRIIWIISGWWITCIVTIYGDYFWFKDQYNIDNSATVVYIIFMLHYGFDVTFIGDLTITSLLGYIGLKFDQINEWLQQSLEDNIQTRTIKRSTGQHSMLNLRQRKILKISRSKWIIWIVIHLHSELCKISQEVNMIFSAQMTLKMGNYFCCIALGLHAIFNILLIKNYVSRGRVFFIMVVFWSSLYLFKLLLINYMCERVSIKASATGDFVNKILDSTYDIETRENISQLLLKIAGTPLRFRGYGFFEFGFKFLHGFVKSVATVLIIIIQSHVNE
ncbi:hypothetical protein X777_14745 [Ooceraea biroi]|nr:hypothetical protein X777_14745 [Ooceraea biroi]